MQNNHLLPLDLLNRSTGQYTKCLFVIALLFATPRQALRAQSTEAGLAALSPLVGSWESRLDPKYYDHPMVKRFNPELKSQEMVFEWGAGSKVLRVRVYNLDRPNDGDKTLVIEGLAVVHPSSSQILMFEYNAESEAYFEGTYAVKSNEDVERTYTIHFSNGTSDRYREIWSWKDEKRERFDWITERLVGTEFVVGEIVVEWIRR